VLRTFSKLCGMASLRLGYAGSSRAIIKNLQKVRPTYDVNALAVSFAGALLKKGDIIENLINEADAGKRYLIDNLRKFGIEYIAGNANFVLIRCPAAADKIALALAEKNILVHGGFKQRFLKDCIRVTIGNRAVMKKFWNSFIKEWRRAL
jgi:histidinol-phosphate aminotransferase